MKHKQRPNPVTNITAEQVIRYIPWHFVIYVDRKRMRESGNGGRVIDLSAASMGEVIEKKFYQELKTLLREITGEKRNYAMAWIGEDYYENGFAKSPHVSIFVRLTTDCQFRKALTACQGENGFRYRVAQLFEKCPINLPVKPSSIVILEDAPETRLRIMRYQTKSLRASQNYDTSSYGYSPFCVARWMTYEHMTWISKGSSWRASRSSEVSAFVEEESPKKILAGAKPTLASDLKSTTKGKQADANDLRQPTRSTGRT